MRGHFHFESALKEWENPPELPASDDPELPELGNCPQCRQPLNWDGIDETVAWCDTPGCKYDNGISEEANRELVRDGRA